MYLLCRQRALLFSRLAPPRNDIKPLRRESNRKRKAGERYRQTVSANKDTAFCGNKQTKRRIFCDCLEIILLCPEILQLYPIVLACRSGETGVRVLQEQVGSVCWVACELFVGSL